MRGSEFPKFSDRRQPTRRNVLLGLRLGLYLATLWSAVALFGYVVSGGRNLEKVGVSLPAAVVGYVAVGLLCGSLWGVCRPLARWWWGAALLGFIVGMPASAILLSLVAPLWQWVDILKLSVIMAVIFGPVTGIIVRWDASRH